MQETPIQLALSSMKEWLVANNLGFCTLGSHSAPLGSLRGFTVQGSYVAQVEPKMAVRYTDRYTACDYCRNSFHPHGQRGSDDYVTHTFNVLDFPLSSLEFIREVHLPYLMFRHGPSMTEAMAQEQVVA